MYRLYIGFKNKVTDELNIEFPNKKLVHVDNLDNFIKSYSKFFDSDKIFLHNNCNNDDLKIIANYIESYKSLHFLFYEDESFDGRSSLIQKIKKEKCIFDYSFPVVGEISALHRFVKNYLSNYNCNIDYDCLNWIVENCPIIRNKIKGTKKEKLSYDLEILTQELNKIISVKNKIEITDFDNSSFKSDNDIFLFFDYIFSGNLEKSLSSCVKLNNSIGEQSALMVLIYHLIFLIEISGLREKNYRLPDKIIHELELRSLLGKYLSEEWKETEFIIKTQNPVRINIELSKKLIPTKKLSKALSIVVDTVLDLRNNGVYNNSMHYMLFKLTKEFQ